MLDDRAELAAITVSGVLLLATPLLLPTRTHLSDLGSGASAEDVRAASSPGSPRPPRNGASRRPRRSTLE